MLRFAGICVLFLSLSGVVAARDGCAGPGTGGARRAWPRDARVRVLVSRDFLDLPGARQAIGAAFKAWEEAGRESGNGSGVTFEVVFEDFEVLMPSMFRVTYRPIPSGRQAQTWIFSDAGGVLGAWCLVDTRVTDPVALRHALAHEIGHTFGLGECEGCEPGSSVMTPFSGDFNDVVSGRGGPSDCDHEAVRAALHGSVPGAEALGSAAREVSAGELRCASATAPGTDVSAGDGRWRAAGPRATPW